MVLKKKKKYKKIIKIFNFWNHFYLRFNVFLFEKKKSWSSFWRDHILLKKIIYTVFMVSVFIVAGTFTAPGIKLQKEAFNQTGFIGILNIVSGGGLRSFSVMALGISPFITASLVMQILKSKIFPPFYRLQQSGPQGRVKLNIITRIMTIFFAYTQSISLINILNNRIGFGIQIAPELDFFWFKFIVLPLILIAGSLFAIFISEQISLKGLANGTSILIFSGIALQIPNQIKSAFNYFIPEIQNSSFVSWINFFIYLAVFIFMIAIVILIYQSERRIPIQQTGEGMAKTAAEISWLPIKANPSGIMSLIFASIILSFPFLISGLYNPNTSLVRNWIENNLNLRQPIGFSLFAIITVLLSIFMGLQQMAVDKIAEDFNKNSTFIPGIRPGKQTEDYLVSVVLRLSFFSVFYLLIIGSLNFVQQYIFGFPVAISFGGTSLVILCNSAVDVIQQIIAIKRIGTLSKKKRKINAIITNPTKLQNYEGDFLW